MLAIKTENEDTHYLSIVSSATSHSEKAGLENSIKISGKYGNALKLKHGQQVLFWEPGIGLSPKISYAELSCCSKDDWEILVVEIFIG